MLKTVFKAYIKENLTLVWFMLKLGLILKLKIFNGDADNDGTLNRS